MADITFEQVKILVEHMPDAEKERLRTWLNNPGKPEPVTSQNMTWGERLVALVNQFDLGDEDQMDIGDPEEWVRQHRTQTRNPGWGG